MIAALLVSLALTAPQEGEGQARLLAAPFSDHVVLQRDRPIEVWGRGEPGGRVEVAIHDQRAVAEVQPDGRWRATLDPMAVGGPYTLTAAIPGGPRETASDVMLGDVWLCSGQSNMEMQVRYALNGYNAAAASSDPALRMFTVAKDFDRTPQTDLRQAARWIAASPETTGDFSAVCFYFGQELRRTQGVPIGLITSAWGGSSIQSWMSSQALGRLGYEPDLALMRRLDDDPAGAYAAWGARWEAAWDAASSDRPWRTSSDDWRAVPAMSPWEEWGDPELAVYDGLVWYEATITLDAGQSARASQLSLGGVDEADLTWINGRAIGGAASGDRHYPVPVGVLRPGENRIVVAVSDSWGAGGIYGPAEKRALVFDAGDRLLIPDTAWRYRATPGAPSPPRPPWSSTSGLATIGNAMIAPLEGYGLSGVLWYQGESNTGEAMRYGALLEGLTADWRGLFGEDLPFFVVQLAGFGLYPTAPGGSDWAELREAVREAARRDPVLEVAAAHDLGDQWDIHPGQKREIGLRLARAARHLVYEDPASPSGPDASAASRVDDRIVVRFDGVTGALGTQGSEDVIGLELCDEQGGACRYVPGRAVGQTIEITVPSGQAADQVRMCWADNPVCNLIDASGAPALPFRLTVP